MMPARLFHHPSRLLAACCVLALSACASNEALHNQLASSREAVDQAKITGAAERAPADFDTAVNKLNEATAAADNRKEKDAMRLAREAEIDANLARARNDAVRAQVATAELEKSNQIMREAYQRAHPNQ